MAQLHPNWTVLATRAPPLTPSAPCLNSPSTLQLYANSLSCSSAPPFKPKMLTIWTAGMQHEAWGKWRVVSAIRSVLSNAMRKSCTHCKSFPKSSGCRFIIHKYLSLSADVSVSVSESCCLSVSARRLWRHHHLLLFWFRAYQVAGICIDLLTVRRLSGLREAKAENWN